MIDTHTSDAALVPTLPPVALRWFILFVAWAALLLSFLDRLIWANVAVQVGGSLGLPIKELGIFVTAFYMGYVVANALGGVATDWLGSRRTLACALIPLGASTFLFSFTTSREIGLLLQVLMGLAAGADYSACVKLTAAWFPFKQRGRAMGFLMTASSAGVVIANALVPTLSQSLGWGAVYRIMGTVTAIAGVACFFVLRDAPATRIAPVRPPHVARLWGNRDLMFLALAGFGALWGTWGFAFWSNALMIKGYGISPVRAGIITMMYGVGAIAAKPLVGLLSDWLGGRRKLLIIICLACFVGMLLIFGELRSERALLLTAPILGITAFVYSPLTAAMVAEIAGPDLAGSATGLTNAFWQLGSVTVPLAVGAVFQQTHSFFAAFVTLALGPLFGVIMMFAVRERAAY